MRRFLVPGSGRHVRAAGGRAHPAGGTYGNAYLLRMRRVLVPGSGRHVRAAGGRAHPAGGTYGNAYLVRMRRVLVPGSGRYVRAAGGRAHPAGGTLPPAHQARAGPAARHAGGAGSGRLRLLPGERGPLPGGRLRAQGKYHGLY